MGQLFGILKAIDPYHRHVIGISTNHMPMIWVNQFENTDTELCDVAQFLCIFDGVELWME